jgi:hypothetical protein
VLKFYISKKHKYNCQQTKISDLIYVRLRTDERHAEKAKILGVSSINDDPHVSQSSQGHGQSQSQKHSQRGAEGGAGGGGGSPQGILKGHVRRKNGELKPVRWISIN